MLQKACDKMESNDFKLQHHSKNSIVIATDYFVTTAGVYFLCYPCRQLELLKLTARTIETEKLSATIWFWLKHWFWSRWRWLMLHGATTHEAYHKSNSHGGKNGFV